MSQATQLRDRLLSSDAFGKYLTGILAVGGTLQYFDLVNLFQLLAPEQAAGVVALVSVVKLAINAWNGATADK